MASSASIWRLWPHRPEPRQEYRGALGLDRQHAEVGGLLVTMVVMPGEADAVDDHRNDAGDEGDICGARARRIDWLHGKETQRAARFVIHRQQLAIAIGRRERRIALIEVDARRRLGKIRPYNLAHR